MDELKNIVFNGEYIDLTTLSMERLKEILNQINDNEIMIKQELDNMLKTLM